MTNCTIQIAFVVCNLISISKRFNLRSRKCTSKSTEIFNRNRYYFRQILRQLVALHFIIDYQYELKKKNKKTKKEKAIYVQFNARFEINPTEQVR